MQALHRLAPLALILALSVPATAQEAIPWQTNLDQAKKIAGETNRLVLVHFWAQWCGPCKRLERSVFSQPSVGAALNASYVPVKLNLDQNRLLAQKYNVRSIPTDVIITPAGQVVTSFVSPQDSQTYIAQVSQVAQKALHQTGTQLAQAGAAIAPQGSSPYAGIGQPYQAPGSGAPQYQNAAVQNHAVQNPAPVGPPAGDRYAQASYGTQPTQPQQSQYAAGVVAPVGNYGPQGQTPQQPAQSNYGSASPSDNRYAAPQGQTSNPAYGANPNQAAQDRYSQGSSGAPQNNAPPAAGAYLPAQNPNNYGGGDRYGSAPAQQATSPQSTYPPQQSAPYGQQPARGQTINPYNNPVAPPQAQQAQQAPVQQTPVQQQPARQAPMQQPVVQQNPYVQQQPQRPTQPQKMSAAKASPYALDGYCPVELMNGQRWTMGDKQFGAVHRGQTFLFTSAENQKQFLANPDRFAPALGGIDPILALENQQSVFGKRNHGVYYRDRIYLFSNETTLNRFNQNPGHYAEGVRQALLRQNNASQLR